MIAKVGLKLDNEHVTWYHSNPGTDSIEKNYGIFKRRIQQELKRKHI